MAKMRDAVPFDDLGYRQCRHRSGNPQV